MRRAGAPYARLLFEHHVRRNDIDLFEASLSIAAEEYPRLDFQSYRLKLDRLCAAARSAAAGASGTHDVLQKLNGLLFDEEGFHGCADGQDDPRCSFISDVLDRRTGLPLSLCLVYMAISGAAGLPMVGIGLPGHFVVRTRDATPPVYVDPFHRGALLSLRDCQAIVEKYAGSVPLRPYLRPLTHRQILQRALGNLKGVYLKSGDDGRAAAAIERILVLDPLASQEARDLGLLYLRMGFLPAAFARLLSYVGQANGSDVAEIEKSLPAIRELAFPRDRLLRPIHGRRQP